MRKLAILTALALVAALAAGVMFFSGGGQRVMASHADGLVAYWPFDDGSDPTADKAHGDNDGDITGASYVGSGGAPLVPGNLDSLSFDGSGDFVEVAQDSDLDMTSPYTASIWVDVTDVATYRPIMVRGATGADDIEIYVQWTSQDLIVAHNRGNGGTFDHVGFVDPPIASYFHLCVTFDGTDVNAYYDGVAAAVTQNTTAMGGPLDTNKGWWIGKVDHTDFSADGSGPPDYFLGDLDEARLYNQALSAAECKALSDYSSTNFSVSLTPVTDTNAIGTSHTVYATVTPNLAEIPILFEVSGANPQPSTFPGYIYTDGSGVASFTWTGTIAGTDFITACIDFSNAPILGAGGVCFAGPYGSGAAEPGDTATKDWFDEYVEVGGNAGANTPDTPGKSLQWAFSGFANNAVAGSITINYRELDTTCTFTPTGSSTFALRESSEDVHNGSANLPNDTADLGINGGTGDDWANSCGGTAQLNFMDRNAGTDIPSPRGAVWVDASVDIYDIKCDPTHGQWCPLVTGNVHVVDLSP